MSWLISKVLYESLHSLREPEVASLGGSSLDGEPSVQSNGSHIPQAYCAPAKMTAFSRLSQYGMTFKPLTEDLGEALLMSFREAFRAKTSPQQERQQELTESGQECGEKWRGSFVKFDQDSCSWRTHQCSLLGDLEPISETWPRWGLMRDGECWEQQMSAHLIRETESGSLPDGETFFHTPNTTGLDGGSNSRKALRKRMEKLPTPTASMMPCEGTVRIMRKRESSDMANSCHEGIRTRSGGDGEQSDRQDRTRSHHQAGSRANVESSELGKPSNMEKEILAYSKRSRSQSRHERFPRPPTEFFASLSSRGIEDHANELWGTEPDVGRVAHGVAARVDRLKAIGNGQVPLCAAAAWTELMKGFEDDERPMARGPKGR